MQRDRPVVFLLHGLGGSARAFDGVVERLVPDFECVAIDLPGFGDAADAVETGVAATVDLVEAIVRERAPPQWLLVGHSMGGKIATVLAARARLEERGLPGLAGVLLLAGSPPSPEPMDEARRRMMLSWVERGPIDEPAARRFVADNTGAPLPPDADERAVRDLMRTSPAAWRGWLKRGSKEDWSATVGVLHVPASILVGGEDGDLGEAGQRATNLHVYPRAGIVSEPGAGHLLPFERPDAVARDVRRLWRESGREVG